MPARILDGNEIAAGMREEMRRELKELSQRLNTTTIYVTHDQVEALAMSDRVAVMDAGRIVQEGEPRAIYLEPSCHFVARFLGATNALEGVIRGGPDRGGFVDVDTACGVFRARMANPIEDQARVLVIARPEAITLTRNRPPEETNVFSATVDAVSFVGDSMEYRVSLEAAELAAQGDPFDPLEEGEGVYVYVAPQRCLLVQEDDGNSDSGGAMDVAGDAVGLRAIP